MNFMYLCSLCPYIIIIAKYDINKGRFFHVHAHAYLLHPQHLFVAEQSKHNNTNKIYSQQSRLTTTTQTKFIRSRAEQLRSIYTLKLLAQKTIFKHSTRTAQNKTKPSVTTPSIYIVSISLETSPGPRQYKTLLHNTV